MIPAEFIKDDIGRHNGATQDSTQRLITGRTYADLSTVWITPTRGQIKPRVVASWMALMRPMNQPFVGPIFIEGDEVGIAYQKAFDMVLEHPELRKFKYVLTVEEDNLPPSDGLMKLYESIEKGYDYVSGLYWTKSEAGQPLILGDPNVMPRNFVPQVPKLNTLQPCNGAGMGFGLWSVKSLREKLKDMPKPWFRTVQEKGTQFTQDLWFFNEAAKYGFKMAVDTRCLVGHMDSNGIIW